MSNTDSFIDEVTEEVQRDRLVSLARKYGWIVAVAVVAIVGGTAYNEYRKSAATQAAKEKGAAIEAALDHTDAAARGAALSELVVDGDPVAAFLAAAQFEEAGQIAEAVALLEALAKQPAISPLYRDLALVKRLAIDPKLDDANRALMLDALAQPGGAYRTIAVELQALAEIQLGQSDAAIEQLQRLLQDAEASAAQRQRVAQLIIALGATPELATQGFDATDLQRQ